MTKTITCNFYSKEFNENSVDTPECLKKCLKYNSPYDYRTVLCSICKKEFNVCPEQKKYCSVKCRDIGVSGHSIRKCAVCKNKFKPILFKQKYCSAECRDSLLPDDILNIIYEQENISQLTKCITCGKEFKKRCYTNRYCSKKCFNNAPFYFSNSSFLEEMVVVELNGRDLEYERQFKIGKYYVDFIIKPDIVIEVDGKYWHSLPKIIEKDKIKTELINSLGYKFYRISEDEVNRDVHIYIDKILEDARGCLV